MDQNLAITVRSKAVPFVDQLLAEFDVVEDFSVANHPDGVIFVAQWLPAAFDIDDRQACVPKQAMPLQQFLATLIIGSAMAQRRLSALRPRADAVIEARVGVVSSVDSAHLSVSFAPSQRVRRRPSTVSRLCPTQTFARERGRRRPWSGVTPPDEVTSLASRRVHRQFRLETRSRHLPRNRADNSSSQSREDRSRRPVRELADGLR